jgi:predicted transcriptional regulator
MNIETYWKKLEEAGLLNYLSDAEKKEFHAQLKKNLKTKQ